jgi:hypothetical protein
LLLRPSRALDALRKAGRYDALENAVSIVIGGALVTASAALPLAQKIMLAAPGGVLLATGTAFLALRQVRGYRIGRER